MDQLSPEEKLTGKNNFDEAVGVTRRDFLQGVIAAGAVSGAGLGAMYFGYNKIADPVRVGVIGTGDEGNVCWADARLITFEWLPLPIFARSASIALSTETARPLSPILQGLA